jgi:hypothetical protein
MAGMTPADSPRRARERITMMENRFKGPDGRWYEITNNSVSYDLAFRYPNGQYYYSSLSPDQSEPDVVVSSGYAERMDAAYGRGYAEAIAEVRAEIINELGNADGRRQLLDFIDSLATPAVEPTETLDDVEDNQIEPDPAEYAIYIKGYRDGINTAKYKAEHSDADALELVEMLKEIPIDFFIERLPQAWAISKWGGKSFIAVERSPIEALRTAKEASWGKK